MPRKYSLETLPKPNSEDVVLISLPARRFAVMRFLKPIGKLVLAFYNPPWTLPFLRRNEIMI